MERFFNPNYEKYPVTCSVREINTPEKAISFGNLHEEIFTSYYDVSNTITTALTSNPGNPDNPNYNQENVYMTLGRNARKLWIENDAALGGSIIYAVVSHKGGSQSSNETPI